MLLIQYFQLHLALPSDGNVYDNGDYSYTHYNMFIR